MKEIQIALLWNGITLKWRALFRNAISASPKIEFAKPITSSEIMFWKIALYKYLPITHSFICKKLYSKTQIMNFALAFQTHIWEWRLLRFGKELFMYNILGLTPLQSDTPCTYMEMIAISRIATWPAMLKLNRTASNLSCGDLMGTCTAKIMLRLFSLYSWIFFKKTGGTAWATIHTILAD